MSADGYRPRIHVYPPAPPARFCGEQNFRTKDHLDSQEMARLKEETLSLPSLLDSSIYESRPPLSSSFAKNPAS